MKRKTPEEALGYWKGIRQKIIEILTEDQLAKLDDHIQSLEDTIRGRQELYKKAADTFGRIVQPNKSADRGSGILVVEENKRKPFFSIEDIRRASPLK